MSFDLPETYMDELIDLGKLEYAEYVRKDHIANAGKMVDGGLVIFALRAAKEHIHKLSAELELEPDDAYTFSTWGVFVDDKINEALDHVAGAGKLIDDRVSSAVSLIETLVRALSDVQCRDDFDKFEVDSALDEYKKWKAENENS